MERILCFEYIFAFIRKHTLFYTLTEWGSLMKSLERDLYCLIVSISFKLIAFILLWHIIYSTQTSPSTLYSLLIWKSINIQFVMLWICENGVILHIPYIFLLRIFSMKCHPTVPFPSPHQENKYTSSVFVVINLRYNNPSTNFTNEQFSSLYSLFLCVLNNFWSFYWIAIVLQYTLLVIIPIVIEKHLLSIAILHCFQCLWTSFSSIETPTLPYPAHPTSIVSFLPTQ